MINIFGIIGICVSGAVLLFSILAVALPKWDTVDLVSVTEYKNVDLGSLYIGLWKYCTEGLVGSTCSELSSNIITDEQWKSLKAIRAMVMLGILLSAGALVVGILVMFVLKSSKLLFFVAGGLDIAAGLFLMIGMAVYIDKRPKEIYSYGMKFDILEFGAAFALDITAWLLAWVAGGAYIGAKIMGKE